MRGGLCLAISLRALQIPQKTTFDGGDTRTGAPHAPPPGCAPGPPPTPARAGLVFSTGTSSAHVGGHAPCVQCSADHGADTSRVWPRGLARARARHPRAGGPVTSRRLPYSHHAICRPGPDTRVSFDRAQLKPRHQHPPHALVRSWSIRSALVRHNPEMAAGS